MGRFIEVVLLYGVIAPGLLALLVTLAVGPSRAWRTLRSGWNWLVRRRLEPEEILTQVVKQYATLVEGLRKTLAKAEAAEQAILQSVHQSEKNLAELELEAEQAASSNDDLHARAVLFKLNIERQALESFCRNLDEQRGQILDIRKHLYLVELQLRQYEVGRSILISELAKAQTAEQQFKIASEFDPFSAVASWKQAEGMVHEKSLNARAAGRVAADLAEAVGSAPAETQVDPSALEVELEELKHRTRQFEQP